MLEAMRAATATIGLSAKASGSGGTLATLPAEMGEEGVNDDLPCPWCHSPTSVVDAACPGCRRRFG